MMMKCLIFLACLVGCAIASNVNYNQCSWHYGDPTQMISCPPGFIGVGACGNKGQSRCDGRAFGIYCCQIINVGNGKRNCAIQRGGNGDNTNCQENAAVFGTCGSLDMARCSQGGDRTSITIDCCETDVRFRGDTCSWKYAANQGESLFCNPANNEIMTGRCGSLTMAKCNGDVHGIKCCQQDL